VAIEVLDETSHLTLHYHFEGGGASWADTYRPENPWQKMQTLRRKLEDTDSDTCEALGVELVSWPDKSVWRLNLRGNVSSTTLENTARALLDEIEGMLDELWPRDEIRVIFGDGVGVIREVSLTP